MDLSKLPKLSQTQQQEAQRAGEAPSPSQQQQPQVVERVVYVEHATSGGPEAWISFAMGALILFMNPTLLQYLLMSPASFAKIYSVTDENGQPLAYPKSVFFPKDIAITAFCLILILDGLVVLFARKPTIIWIALVLTIAAVIANLGFVLYAFNKGYGMQILPLIAVMYGVYIAIFQWRLIKKNPDYANA